MHDYAIPIYSFSQPAPHCHITLSTATTDGPHLDTGHEYYNMRYIIRLIICGLFHHLFFCPKNPLLASFLSLLTYDNRFICDKQFPPHGQVVTVLHLDQQFCSPPRCIFEYRGTIQYSNFGPYKIEYTFVNLNIRIFNITWAAKIKYGGYSNLAVPDPQELKYFTLIFGTYFITSIQIFS